MKMAKKQEEKKVKVAGLKGGQKMKVVEMEPEVVKETGEAGVSAKRSKNAVPKVRGKKYQEVKANIDRSKNYGLEEAITLVKNSSYSKFDGTMEIHLIVKKQGLSVNVTLPYLTGKSKKIEVADEATIEKLKTGKIDFDVLLSTAEMMPKLVPYAKILGPRGMMPNPKNGTLIKTDADAKKFSQNSATIKTEKTAPLMHTTFGKVGQKDEELVKNLEAILDAINRKQVMRAFIKATMSPSVRIAI